MRNSTGILRHLTQSMTMKTKRYALAGLVLALGLAAVASGLSSAQSTETLPKKLGHVIHPKFRWPLIGKVTQDAGTVGLDVIAPIGQPVHAAAEGDVIYAGDELKTYGNLVLIRHVDGYVTAYSGLSEILVVNGAKVKRGETIGKSGDTGEVSSPRLHFELRKDGASVDPKGYMAPM